LGKPLSDCLVCIWYFLLFLLFSNIGNLDSASRPKSHRTRRKVSRSSRASRRFLGCDHLAQVRSLTSVFLFLVSHFSFGFLASFFCLPCLRVLLTPPFHMESSNLGNLLSVRSVFFVELVRNYSSSFLQIDPRLRANTMTAQLIL
jgi:hypothetical protein